MAPKNLIVHCSGTKDSKYTDFGSKQELTIIVDALLLLKGEHDIFCLNPLNSVFRNASHPRWILAWQRSTADTEWIQAVTTRMEKEGESSHFTQGVQYLLAVDLDPVGGVC